MVEGEREGDGERERDAPGYLEVRGLVARYPEFRLGPIDLSLGKGETLVVLGPNGSGKSTFLRLLAGLEPVERGRIRLAGRDITDLPPHLRSVGMVFQDLALFPGKTVWDNLTYGLVVQRWSRQEAEKRGEELLRDFHLSLLAERLPSEISGGERQRVALARALAPRPSLLLLDEPLSSADPRLARELRGEIKGYLRAAGTPAIYVTHDFDEGFFLAQRMALLREGSWVQEGPAEQVFDRPSDPFVAWFLGYNVLLRPSSRHGTIAVLPEEVRLCDPGAPDALEGVVESRGETGSQVRMFVRLSTPAGPMGAEREESPLLELLLPRGGAGAGTPAVGAKVHLRFERTVELPQDLPPNGFKRGFASGEPGGP